MKPFSFIPVETIEQACGLLAEHGPEALLLAGGTDLLVELRRASARAPRVVVDLWPLHELRGITEAGDSISLGPLTTHTDLLHSDVLRKFAPLLVSAAATIGSPQVRNRGTVGGNIMNAAPCADTVPPLIALGATVTLKSRNGTREFDLADLFVKPYQTKAKPDELLVAIRFPKRPANARSAFIKLGRRNALSISRLSVAAILEFGSDGRITAARLAPGSAFPSWKRVPEAEQMLMGERPGEKLFTAVGQKVSEQMIKETGRRWSTEYKEPVLAVLVRRALEICVAPAVPVTPGVPKAERLPIQAKVRSKPAARSDADHGIITTTINGRSQRLAVPANKTLLDVLRDDLGLTGTKCGCEVGECGACTVLLDGMPVNSCLVLAPQIQGREVTTVEDLAQAGKLHPLQEAFLDYDAVHCGFCTPGILLSAKALLEQNPHPSESEIRTAISGNLCRCSGYQQIVDAIARTAPQDRHEADGRKPAKGTTA